MYRGPSCGLHCTRNFGIGFWTVIENRCNIAFPVCMFPVENESRTGSNRKSLETNKKKHDDDGDKNS